MNRGGAGCKLVLAWPRGLGLGVMRLMVGGLGWVGLEVGVEQKKSSCARGGVTLEYIANFLSVRMMLLY